MHKDEKLIKAYLHFRMKKFCVGSFVYDCDGNLRYRIIYV